MSEDITQVIFPNFKPYVHCDKSSYEFNLGGESVLLLLQKKENIYLFIKS